MGRLFPALIVLILIATGASAQGLSETDERNSQRVWVASMVASIAATSFDAATSWGKLESNSLLASPNGTFGSRGIAIKASLQAALLVPQLLLRKHRGFRTAFVVGNFAEAGVYSAAAIHNLGIPRPNR